MKKIMAGLLALICLAGMMGTSLAEDTPIYQAVIANPNVADRLNIRAAPSVQAESLGRFYSGTPVTVLKETKGSDGEAWAYVQVGNAAWESAVVRGYTMKKYLMEKNRNYGAPELFVTAEPVSGRITPRVRPGNDAEGGNPFSGTVYVLGDIGDDWRYVMDEGWSAHGFVRTGQLRNKAVEIQVAYIMAADGGERVTVYMDKEMTAAAASLYSGAPVRVTDFNRAGWARVECCGARYDLNQGKPALIAGYAAQKDLLVFQQPWTVDWKTRTGYARQEISLDEPGWGGIPRGAALEVMGETGEKYLVRYRAMSGGADLCGLADKSAVEVSALKSVLEGAAGIGYVRAPIRWDEEGYSLGFDVFARPGDEAEGQEYDPLCLLLAELPDGFLQVRKMGEPSFFIRSEGARIIREEELLPRNPAVKREGTWRAEEQDAGLWVYTRETGGASSLTLVNESAGINETYSIREEDGSGTSYAAYIPAGTQVTLKGEGMLTAFGGQGDEPVLLTREGSGGVLESVPLFTGTGRFFCDLQLETCRDYYGFRIRPIDGAENPYFSVSDLFGTEEEYETGVEEGGSWFLDLMPGQFLTLHECELYIFYGNG